jgi:hypothetical protein
VPLLAYLEAACEVIFEDTGSGADENRKGLADALARCAAGDVLVAWNSLTGSGALRSIWSGWWRS